MRLVAGLGNPGLKYATTRHNMGFRALDKLAARFQTDLRSAKFESVYTIVHSAGEQLLLVKPLTWMNHSGRAVQAWIRYYHIELSDVLVVYDEIALNLGRIRLRDSGSSAGHQGMNSIISSLHSDEFARLRLGIGPQPEGMDSALYVLQSFSSAEYDTVESVIALVPDIVMCWSHEGMTQAMNRYNGFSLNEPE